MDTIAGVSLVPVILGLVQVAKIAGLSSQFAPLFSLILGIIFAFLGVGISVDSIVIGIVLGLSSSGLWSSTKAIMGK